MIRRVFSLIIGKDRISVHRKESTRSRTITDKNEIDLFFLLYSGYASFSIQPRKLETEGTLSAIFVIKTRLLFCFPCVVFLYDIQMSIVKRWPVGWIKSEFENKGNVEFWWFFNTNGIWNITRMYKTCEIWANILYVSLIENFASTQPFICSHRQVIYK